MKHLYLVFSLFMVFSSQAFGWQRITIPGAKCGSGLPYSVFVEKKSNTKLLAEFMGGGACWSLDTCYGTDAQAWMFPFPKSPYFSLPTYSTLENPLSNHTKVYFPYCTGDVHAGNHIENFGYGIKAYQVGYTNVQKTWKYLSQKGILQFPKIKEVVLWGASAGAIGAIAHTATIEPYLSADTKKLLVADSPGLHFGPTFWDKFDDAMFADFKNVFGKLGINIKRGDGFVASQMGAAFKTLSDWRISVIQSTRDEVMSLEFGDISEDDHEKLVLGPQGVPAIGAQFSNVLTFIPHNDQHTYLLLPSMAETEDQNGENAWSFFVRSYYTFLASPLTPKSAAPVAPTVPTLAQQNLN